MRRLASYLVAFLIAPLILFLLAESGLRLAHFGHSTQPFVKRVIDGKTAYYRNRYFMRTFLGALPKCDGFQDSEFAVAAVKPPGTYRIFVLGSSAAQGWPTPCYGFPRILEVLLRAQYPDRRFEVYICAYPGLNSHVNLLLAEACAKFQPDLFVVYMGNNELAGPFGLTTPMGDLSPARIRWTVRLRAALANVRLVQWARRFSSPPTPGNFSVLPNDPRIEKTYQVFQLNLRDICTTCIGAGAKMVLCTVGTNLRDWRPSSRHVRLTDAQTQALSQWDHFFELGNDAEKARRFEEAITFYEQALALDDTHAELNYALGRCLFALKRPNEARPFFVKALEWDGFDCVRAKPRLNEIIRATADAFAGRGVVLADAVRKLDEAAPNGIPGWELFYDNCHLSFQGSYVVARAVLEKIVDQLEKSGVPRASTVPLPQQECERRLLWNPEEEWHARRGRLEENHSHGGGMPPDGYAEYEATIKKSGEAWTNHDREQLLQYALAANPTDPFVLERQTNFLYWAQRYDEAQHWAKELTDRFPPCRVGRRILGAILIGQNKYDEAFAEYRKETDLFPDDADTYFAWVSALEQNGRLREALDVLRKAEKGDDTNEAFQCREASLRVKMQQPKQAARAAYEAVSINPQALDGYDALEAVFASTQDGAGRIAAFTKLAARYAHNALPQYHLGLAYEAAGGLADAEDRFKTACAIAPDFLPRIIDDLDKSALAFEQKDRWNDAVARLELALKLDPNNNPIQAKLEQARANIR